MLRTLLLGLAAAAIPILPAAAASATPEEAARLTALFERYVGHPAPGEAGSVAVAPKGDAYAVTLDLKRALGGLERLGVVLDPHTTAVLLTPRPDGTWTVSGTEGPPLVVHRGSQTVSFAAATSAFTGTFDPNLHTFSDFRQDQTGYTVSETTPTLVQNLRVEKVTATGTGTPTAGGKVGIAGHYGSTGLASDVIVKSAEPAPEPGNPAVPPPALPGATVSYTAPNASTDVALDGVRTANLLDLWAFLIAHPSHDSLVGARDELKTLLRAGLPFFDALKQAGSLSTLAVTTPIGVVTAKSVGGSLDATGLDGTGRMALALALVDLVIPPAQLPPWSGGLVPTGLDLHVALDGFHAAEAATEAVNDIDLSKSVIITPEQKEAVGHLLWPGTGSVTLAPSRLTTAMLDLRMEGQAAMGPQPTGRVTVTGRGLDEEIAALRAQSATDPGAGQILGPLVLAKNLSKPNPDGSLLWVIDFGHGPMTINDAPLQ